MSRHRALCESAARAPLVPAPSPCARNRRRRIRRAKSSPRCPSEFGARANYFPLERHQTPAGSFRRRASRPASAPDARSARSASASTYSSASRWSQISLGRSLGQNLGRAAALLRDLGGDVLALGRGNLLQLGTSTPAFLAKAGPPASAGHLCMRRSPRARSSARRRRPGRQRCPKPSHASRRGVSKQVTSPPSQPLACQQRSDALAQFLRRRIDHSRRNLFATNL